MRCGLLRSAVPRSSHAVSRSPNRIRTLAAAALLTAALAAFVFARERRERAAAPAWPTLAGDVTWSLLAVGDTGAPPWWIGRSFQQVVRVGRAMAAEDVRNPVDALVLLGDNFYPDGLHARELDARVRANLSEPFCRFLPADGVPCAAPPRTAQVLAVLGNHDRKSDESVRLQRTEIRRRLPSFLLPEASVHAIDLGSQVSIVLYDGAELLAAGSFEPLRAAVRASRGPWRIVASHHPLTLRESDEEGRAAREVIRGLDVPVHLHLAGHRHYLELAHTPAPPFLQAVAGSGSNTRPLKPPLEGSVYQARRPGFARADIVAGPDGSRLVVSLVALADSIWERPQVVARWSVGPAGDARAEPLADR